MNRDQLPTGPATRGVMQSATTACRQPLKLKIVKKGWVMDWQIYTQSPFHTLLHVRPGTACSCTMHLLPPSELPCWCRNCLCLADARNTLQCHILHDIHLLRTLPLHPGPRSLSPAHAVCCAAVACPPLPVQCSSSCTAAAGTHAFSGASCGLTRGHVCAVCIVCAAVPADAGGVR